MKNYLLAPRGLAAASAALLLALQSPAFAAVKTWSSTAATSDAATGTNWVGGVAPISGTDTLTYTGTSTTLTTTFNNNFTAFGSAPLNFAAATTANFTIGGTGTLTLDTNDTATQRNAVANISTTATTQTINNPVLIKNSASTTIGATITTNAIANAIVFGGNVSYTTSQLNLTGTNASAAISFASLSGSTLLSIPAQGTVTITDGTGLTGTVTYNPTASGTLVLGTGFGSGGTYGTFNLQGGTANTTLKLINSPAINNAVATSGTGKTSVQVDSGTAVISGTLSGARPLEKIGAGTLTLSGSVTASGGITIGGGTLQVGNAGTTGSLGTGAVVNNGALAFNRTDTALNAANTLTGSGTLTQAGTGTSTLSGDLSGFSGPITVNAGNLTVSNGSALTLSQSIANVVGSTFAKTGAGNLTLTGSNTFNGGLTVGATTASCGIVAVTSSAALGGTGGVIISPTGANTGSLRLDGSSGDIVSAVGLGINGRTTPSVQLESVGGHNSIGGFVTLGGGTGTQNYVFDVSAGSLTLSGTVNGGGSGGIVRNLTVGGAGDTIISGPLTNNANTTLNLAKSGAGVLTLSGANTYTGSTTINGGTLLLSGGGGLGAGAVVLGNGATLNASGITANSLAIPAGLAGSGLINATGKTVQISGAYAPLAISVTGNTTLAAGSTSTFTADTTIATRSVTIVTGSLQNGGALTISPAAGFAFASGQSFDFVDASAGITPGFTSVTVGATALSAASAGVWKGGDGTLGYTYTESTGVLSVQTASVSALQTWRNLHFPTAGNDGTGIGANDADPDGDGIPNLLEYATNTSPVAANISPLVVANVGGRLALTFTRISDPAVTYLVQGTNDLGSTWTTITPFSGTNPTTGFTPSTPSATETETVQIVDSELLSAQPRRFLRLQVSIAP